MHWYQVLYQHSTIHFKLSSIIANSSKTNHCTPFTWFHWKRRNSREYRRLVRLWKKDNFSRWALHCSTPSIFWNDCVDSQWISRPNDYSTFHNSDLCSRGREQILLDVSLTGIINIIIILLFWSQRDRESSACHSACCIFALKQLLS